MARNLDEATDEYYSHADTLKASAAKGKLRPTLLPMHALSEVVRVLTVNAAKHGDYTWRDCDPALYEDALGRHVLAYARGEIKDEEGTPHMAAIVCNALILLERELMG